MLPFKLIALVVNVDTPLTPAPNVDVPLSVKVKLFVAPAIVLAKSMPAPVKTAFAPKVTALLYVCAPEVLTAVVLIAVASPVPMLKLVSAALLPTVPPKLVAPLPSATLKACAPLIVLANVTPPLLEVKLLSEPNVIAP